MTLILLAENGAIAQGLPREVMEVLEQNEETFKALPAYQANYKFHSESRDQAGLVLSESNSEGVIEWTAEGVWVDGIWRFQGEYAQDGKRPDLQETEFAIFKTDKEIAYWDIDQSPLVRIFPSGEFGTASDIGQMYQQRVQGLLGHTGFVDDRGRSIKEYVLAYVEGGDVQCIYEMRDDFFVLKMVPKTPASGVIQLEHRYDMAHGAALVYTLSSDSLTLQPRVEAKQNLGSTTLPYLPTRIERTNHKKNGGYITDVAVLELDRMVLGSSGQLSMGRFSRPENPVPEIVTLDYASVARSFPSPTTLKSGVVVLHSDDPRGTYTPPAPPLNWYLSHYWKYLLYLGATILLIGGFFRFRSAK